MNKSALHINSGSIGINITHSQDTAVPCPYPINCRDTALPCPLYHSDATGNDISPQNHQIGSENFSPKNYQVGSENFSPEYQNS